MVVLGGRRVTPKNKKDTRYVRDVPGIFVLMYGLNGGHHYMDAQGEYLSHVTGTIDGIGPCREVIQTIPES